VHDCAGLHLPAHVITMDAALVPAEVDSPAGAWTYILRLVHMSFQLCSAPC